MIHHTPWIERKFNFEFPVTHFPFYVERLKAIHPRLSTLFQVCDEKRLELKLARSWSAKEHVGHLVDLEELHERRIREYLDGKTELSPADMNNDKTAKANHNVSSSAALLEKFGKTRTHFIQRLSLLDEKQLSLSALHPRLQKQMRLVDMVYFVTEHDNHHLTIVSHLLGR